MRIDDDAQPHELFWLHPHETAGADLHSLSAAGAGHGRYCFHKCIALLPEREFIGKLDDVEIRAGLLVEGEREMIA